MTALLLILALAAILHLHLKQRKLMALISSLAPRLQALQNRINTISLDVQRLKDQAAQAGEIPADAEALLFNLSSTVDALAISAAPVPAPSPLP